MDSIRKIFRVPFIERILAKPEKTADSLLGKIIPGNYLYPANSIRSFNRDGINMELDLSDYVQHYIYYNFKHASIDALYSWVKPGMNILDIGTNIGYIALKLAQKTGDKGRVYGFEPDAENFKAAIHNLKLNGWCKNLQIANVGLGNKKGQYKLYQIDAKNKGMNQVQDKAMDKPFSLINIEVLDEYMVAKQILPPNLIKIDAEGYEMNILKGAYNTLAKHKPILFVEVDDANLKTQDSSAKELITFLKEIGYNLTDVYTNKEIVQSDDFTNYHFDCICV